MAIDWAARRAEAMARRDAALAKITPEDAREIAERAAQDALDAEADDAEEAFRTLDLTRRLEAARVRLGPQMKLVAVEIDGHPDTFIVRHDNKAYTRWKRDLNAGKKDEHDKISRTYAMQVVVDWNGSTDFSMSSPLTTELGAHLEKNDGMVIPIVNASTKLAGQFAREQKRR